MTERLWWEELSAGAQYPMGSCPVEREEVIAFATRYDPQPYHIDDEAAAANPVFGRLSASGVHTFAMTSRVLFDGFAANGIAPVGGGGADEMRFTKPVYPGDTLNVAVEVVETRELKSRADLGIARFRTIVHNQDGELVLSYFSTMFFHRRPQDAATSPSS